MSETWFTADTHFGHANILWLTKRPFKTIKEMDEILIKNWNNRVGKNDHVIFLGDFAYKSECSPRNYIERLNGYITFIQGNHDCVLNSPIQYLVVYVDGENAFCVHDPKDFSSSYSINLVGHVHQRWKVKKLYDVFLVNVGVDVWNFAPVNISEILKVKEDFEKKWNRKWKRKYGRKSK
jgi:calcineurin-like phosphoesterase family protein